VGKIIRRFAVRSRGKTGPGWLRVVLIGHGMSRPWAAANGPAGTGGRGFTTKGTFTMRRTRSLPWGMVGVACVGMLVPAPVLQAAVDVGAGQEAASGGANACDVALSDGGVLRGQAVDPQGSPVATIPVSLWQLNREVGRTVTDRAGYFAMSGLQGGTYQITAGSGRGVYRLWAANTAPPSAQPAALVVVGAGQLVRQQRAFCEPIYQWVRCHPWFVVGLAAAAIAVPIAIHNSERSKSPP